MKKTIKARGWRRPALIPAAVCIAMLLTQLSCFAAYNTVPTKMFPYVTGVEIVTGNSPSMEMHIKFSNNVSAVDETQERAAVNPPADENPDYMIGVNERNLTKFHLVETETQNPVEFTVTAHPEAEKQQDTSKYFYIYADDLDVNMDYQVLIDEDLYANMGNSLGVPYIIDFNLSEGTCTFHSVGELPEEEYSQAPLTLDLCNIENNQRDVPADLVLYLRFSFNVSSAEVFQYNQQQVSLVFADDSSKIVPIHVQPGGEAQEISVTPLEELESGTEYRLIIAKEFVARNGVALSSPLNLYFTVAGDGQEPDEPDELIEDYFPDIESNWAREDINLLANLGVVTGTPDGLFLPNNKITRAEVVTILVRLYDLDSETTVSFADTQGHWAAGYISIAAGLGYVNGFDADTFGPNQYISREQMAVILSRIAEFTPDSAEENAPVFTDAGDISDWAVDGVTAAFQNGIINGYPDGTFLPLADITRAEACHMIVNLMESQQQAV